MSRVKHPIYVNIIKRILDILLSLLAIILLSPLLLVVAVLVRCKLGSPVLFHQQRPGKKEKIFRLCKFRTMTDARDAEGNLLPDDVRLTPFGKTLRSTSLDELPELFNILKGEMSIIGPRPLMVSYLPLYNEEQKHRHDIRPGLTGLAQIKGRNAIDWTTRFQYDVYYVENASLWLDLKIFFGTIGAVFSRKGISSDTSETMEDFTGSN